MKKAKVITLFSVLVMAAVISLALAACANPAGEEEMAVFTIDIGGNGRAVGYPPTDPSVDFPKVDDLQFVVYFTPTSPPGANAITFTKDGAGAITGTINPGEYNVTIDIFFLADELKLMCYASGVAVDLITGSPANPVTVKAGKNTIPVAVTKNTSVTLEDGSSANPFIVYDVTTLKAVGKAPITHPLWNLTACYKMMRDIDMDGESFTSIGPDTSNQFCGSFDGNNKTISNLNISTPATYMGLFGYVGPGGEVKNLGMVDCSVNTSSAGGGIVGSNFSGRIENCYYEGNVTSGALSVGGIVGFIRSGSVVRNCYFKGNVSSTDDGVGGVVGGSTASTVEYCYATGRVTGKDKVG